MTSEGASVATDAKRLRESEGRLRLALAAGRMATWDWNIATGEQVWSDSMYEMMGFEVEGTSTDFAAWCTRIHPDDLPIIDKSLRRALNTGAHYSAEYRVFRGDGTVGWFSSLGQVEYGEDGRPLRMVGVFADITTRKLAEAELTKAHQDLLRVSRLSAMGAMASTLAHELNQPLTGIVNYLDAAKRHLTRGADPGFMIDVVNEAAALALRAGEIIRRIRNFTLEGRITRHPEDLISIVAEAARLLERLLQEHGIMLDIEIPERARQVSVDRLQLEQVLTNLFRNAAEAMLDKQVRKVTVTSRLCTDGIELRISDTGSGISGDLDALFDPFGSDGAEGLGLGLPICRTIVEAHGGHIRVEQTGPEGTTFLITLPSAQVVSS